MLSGGAEGCIMGGLITARSEAVSSGHDHGKHAAPHAVGNVVLDDRDATSPIGVPHAPAQCLLVMGCGTAVIAAAEVTIEEPAHAVGGMYADVLLAPDSPSIGLEPPPPRA